MGVIILNGRQYTTVSEVPVSVNTDMNAVLNKKFKTSINYPVDGWAENVNLMGALPERTASGTIAHFNEGADLVPLKSCEVTVTPSQSGTGDPSPSNPRPLNSFSSLTVEHTGANIVDIKAYADWNLSNSYAFLTNCFKANQKAIMCLFDNDTTVDVSGCYLGFVDSSYTAGSPPSTMYKWVLSNGTVSANKVNTASGDANNILNGLIIYPKNETTYNKIFSRYKVLIQYGETQTATTYEPYTPDPHTLDLGSTVYGLTGDCISGEFEETHGVVDFGTLTWTTSGSGTNARWYCSDLVGVIKNPTSSTEILDMKMEKYKPINYGVSLASYPDYISVLLDGRLISYKYDENSPSGLCAYPLATPTALTIDPVEIESFKGVNNIWCTQDNSSVAVEYRADIDLLITELGG